MKQKISRREAEKILRDQQASLPREECRTCECYQGFLVQLEAETAEGIKDIIDPLRVNPFEMHQCLGCDPCPPAEAFRRILD